LGIFNLNKNSVPEREFPFYPLARQAANAFMAWHKEVLTTQDYSRIDEMLEYLWQPTTWLKEGHNQMEMTIATQASGAERKKGAIELAKYNATKRIMNECYEEACKIKIAMLQREFSRSGATTFMQEFELIRFLATSRSRYWLGYQPSMAITGHFHDREDWKELEKRVEDGTFTPDYYKEFRAILRERAKKFNAELVAKKSDFPPSYDFPGEDK